MQPQASESTRYMNQAPIQQNDSSTTATYHQEYYPAQLPQGVLSQMHDVQMTGYVPTQDLTVQECVQLARTLMTNVERLGSAHNDALVQVQQAMTESQRLRGEVAHLTQANDSLRHQLATYQQPALKNGVEDYNQPTNLNVLTPPGMDCNGGMGQHGSEKQAPSTSSVGDRLPMENSCDVAEPNMANNQSENSHSSPSDPQPLHDDHFQPSAAATAPMAYMPSSCSAPPEHPAAAAALEDHGSGGGIADNASSSAAASDKPAWSNQEATSPSTKPITAAELVAAANKNTKKASNQKAHVEYVGRQPWNKQGGRPPQSRSGGKGHRRGGYQYSGGRGGNWRGRGRGRGGKSHRLCRTYTTTGCRFGDQCRFQHEGAGTVVQQQPSSAYNAAVLNVTLPQQAHRPSSCNQSVTSNSNESAGGESSNVWRKRKAASDRSTTNETSPYMPMGPHQHGGPTPAEALAKGKSKNANWGSPQSEW